MISLAQNMWSWTRVHFPGEGALTTSKKSNIFCDIDKGTIRLFDSRLQVSEETFCKILSNCQSERDLVDW